MSEANGGPGSRVESAGSGGRIQRSLFVSACQEPLPAHDRATDTALNVVAWTIDEERHLRALAISPDGSMRDVAADDLVFDHALRPTNY